jgi:nitrate reductase cytochrome c-type subunit
MIPRALVTLLVAAGCAPATAPAPPDPAAALAATQAFLAARPRFEQPLADGLAPARDVHGAPLAMDAASCGSCHATAYAAWRTSTHAHAWVDPQLQAEMTKSGNRWLCANCHTPLLRQQGTWVVGLEDDDVERPRVVPNPAHDAALQAEGVTCVACHLREGRIVGTGRTGAAGASAHALTVDPELGTSAFCGRCHQAEARYPGKSFACTFTTEAEWSASWAAEAGIACQGCHMAKDGAGAAGHAWPGSGLAKVVGQDPAAQPAPRLDARIDRTGTVPVVAVSLTNVFAGHPVPAGDPERFLEVRVEWRGSGGRVLRTDRAEVGQRWTWWPEPRQVADERLAPRASRTWRWPAPAGATGVVVTLRRARMRPEAAAFHSLDGYPVAMDVESRELDL